MLLVEFFSYYIAGFQKELADPSYIFATATMTSRDMQMGFRATRAFDELNKELEAYE